MSTKRMPYEDAKSATKSASATPLIVPQPAARTKNNMALVSCIYSSSFAFLHE